MLFAPTPFSKFGSTASVVLRPPRYDLSLSVTNRTLSGLILETTACSGNGLIVGQSSAILAKTWGTLEANLDTTGFVADAKITYNKLYHPDLQASLLISPHGPNLGQVEIHYAPKEFLVGSISGVYRKEQLLGSVSGSIGADGLSVGGQVEAVYEKEEVKLRDFNMGFQYTGRDFVAALFTKVGRERNGVFQGGNSEDMAISYIHRVSPTYAVAAQFDVDKARDPVMAVGVDYRLDKQSDIKVIGNTEGVIHTRLTHVLADPRVKFSVASQFDAHAFSFQSKKFGIAASFGDF